MKEVGDKVRLLDALRPFVLPELSGSDHAILKQWIDQALRYMMDGEDAAAFAPLDGYFRTPREFRHSFAKMVDAEFSKVKVGNFRATSLISLALKAALDRIMLAESRLMLDERRVDPRIFELLELLFDLDAQAAYEWALSAVSDRGGFAKLRSANQTAVPLALFFASPSLHMGYGAEAAAFERSVFDWCVDNAQEGGIDTICLSLLPRVLATELSYGAGRSVERQAEIFVRLAAARTKDNQSLLSALDALAWRNARVAADDTLDSAVSSEAAENFLAAVNDLARSYAPGLPARLEELGLGGASELVFPDRPVRQPLEAHKPDKKPASFGGGNMLDDLMNLFLNPQDWTEARA